MGAAHNASKTRLPLGMKEAKHQVPLACRRWFTEVENRWYVHWMRNKRDTALDFAVMDCSTVPDAEMLKAREITLASQKKHRTRLRMEKDKARRLPRRRKRLRRVLARKNHRTRLRMEKARRLPRGTPPWGRLRISQLSLPWDIYMPNYSILKKAARMKEGRRQRRRNKEGSMTPNNQKAQVRRA